MSRTAASLPLRLTDAERINPYQLLIDLHAHAIGRSTCSDKEEALAELALAAAVVMWWGRWQPLTIHAALRAGASVPDIVAATGLDTREVLRRWQAWTEVQAELLIGGRPAIDVQEVQGIRARLTREEDSWN